MRLQVAKGLYQPNGMILDDANKQSVGVADFCLRAGNLLKRPLHNIFLEAQPDMSLFVRRCPMCQ